MDKDVAMTNVGVHVGRKGPKIAYNARKGKRDHAKELIRGNFIDQKSLPINCE